MKPEPFIEFQGDTPGAIIRVFVVFSNSMLEPPVTSVIRKITQQYWIIDKCVMKLKVPMWVPDERDERLGPMQAFESQVFQ